MNDDETIDNWPTVLFQRKHFESVAAALINSGHTVAELDFDTGKKILDKFIDLPPYDWEEILSYEKDMSGSTSTAHLKLSVDGFPSTCFGMTVIKKK